MLASITGHYFMAAIKIGVKICFFQSLAPCSFKPILCPIDLSLVSPTLQSFLCSDHFTLEVDLISDALLLVFKKQKSRKKDVIKGTHSEKHPKIKLKSLRKV